MSPELKQRVNRFRNGAQAKLDRPEVKRGLDLAQKVLLVLIVGYLVYRLTQVGWGAVANALPVSPWFYLFFVLRFVALPISELAIYEIVWDRPLARHFPVFIRKRVYNYAVLGYSGEAFLTIWARRALDLSDRDVVVGVKDNNLLSALTSNIATVLLIAALAITGGLQAGIDAFPGAPILFAIAFTTASVLTVTVIFFRKKLIALPDGKMPRMMTIHGVRQTTLIVLQICMYASALPGAPLFAWFIFVTLQLVLSRIPFLPNQDIVYLSAALSLAPLVGAPEADVAGMLVAEAGLSQLVNIVFFFATAHLAKSAAIVRGK